MHYIKGSQLTIPDALSRAPLSDVTAEIPEPEITYYVHSIMSIKLLQKRKSIQ